VKSGTVRIGSETAKGYKLEAFQKAFKNYLPATSELSVTSVTSPRTGVVTDVTDRNGGSGGVDAADAQYERDERAAMAEDR